MLDGTGFVEVPKVICIEKLGILPDPRPLSHAAWSLGLLRLLLQVEGRVRRLSYRTWYCRCDFNENDDI
jgi:hypothetical protein